MKIGSTDDTTTGKEAERKTSMPDGTTMRSDCIIAWSEFLAVSARYAERQMHEKTLRAEIFSKHVCIDRLIYCKISPWPKTIRFFRRRNLLTDRWTGGRPDQWVDGPTDR